MKSLKTDRGINTVPVYTVLEAEAPLMIFPFVWMVFISFRSAGESMQISPIILPEQWVKENYLRAIASLSIMKLYIDMALLILFQVLCAIAFSSVTGFAFTKLKFRGEDLLFSLVIIQMMLLSQIFITPQCQMLAGIGLTDSTFALVFPGLISAFSTFFLRQAYMDIPDELGEATYLNGCTRRRIFTKIMMPLTRASTTTLTVLTAVLAYVDLTQPLTANTDLNMMTLSAGLFILRGRFITDYPVLMVGSALVIVPMVILYLVFQKQFTEGIAMTGGK